MKKLFRLEIKNNDCDFERIDRLRIKMQKRKASICSERALLYTHSFQTTENETYIIRKAKAFAHTLENMSIYIEKDSLIFGNMASRNFAAPIYPEYSIDWIIDELDYFEKRQGDVFLISEDVKQDLKGIASYWHGHTHEDEVNRKLPEINRKAEKQKVLHRGGISMSGDGHIVPKHEMVLEKGFGGIIKDAKDKLEKATTHSQIDFYKSLIIANQAALSFIKRYGILALDLAQKEGSPKRKSELLTISNMCETLLEGKVNHFYEAVEACYIIHLLQMIESNGHSFCYGRFDQYIYPYYQKDLQEHKITQEKALEIITHMFIMNSSCNKVRPYAHTKFSQGYPLYSNLMISGYVSESLDGTNPLSYLCIEAMHQCSLAEPNFSMRYNKRTPQKLLEDAAKLIASGCGMPSMFNDEVVIEAMQSIQIPANEAYDYCAIGCVETGIPGKYNHRATGMTYVNWGKLLEMLVNNGVDPESGIQLISINGETNSNIEFHTYQELWSGWLTLLEFYTDLAVDCDHVCDASLQIYDADPFASGMIDNCLELGKTLKMGGAKYDVVSQSNIGPSVVGDGLAVLKKLVIEEKKITLEQLKEAMKHNWQGKEYGRIYQMVKKVAKFGNDIDEVDEIVKDIFDSYLDLLPKYETLCAKQGPVLSAYTMSTSNITSYVPNGLDVGATSDGRYAFSPLNEGCSPTQGNDTNGPTALINSVSKLPNCRIAAGQLLNMRFSPDALKGDNLSMFVYFLRACCEKKIFHNQFNVVDTEVLKDAQKNPQKHTDLIIRVAGYCAQFISLMPQAQDAIIERTQNHWNA